jgi:hypothetical protein
MDNKKGFQMAISTIVMLVLAMMILLFLILFFTGGAGDFMGKIRSYFGYSNVDNVIEGCNILGDTSQTYDFCCGKKDVKYYIEGEKSEGKFSCYELVDQSFIGGNINSLDCLGVSC